MLSPTNEETDDNSGEAPQHNDGDQQQNDGSSPGNIQNDGIMIEPSPAPPALPAPPLVLSDNVIRAIFLLLGVGILLPWNAFVSSKPYFAARLCNPEDGDDIVNFEQWFGLIWNTSSVLSLGLIIFGQAVADYCKKRRAAVALTQDAALVLVVSMSPQQFLVVTLCGLAVCGTCGAIATAGIVSTASLFPSHVGINPFFSGQALGGVAVSLANFVAATVEDPAEYFDQHCAANNHTTASISSALSSISSLDTSVSRTITDQQSPQFNEDGPDHSCSPYEHLDWAVFLYFLAGCIVLLLCLAGYHLIHIYQIREFRDDYEVVHDGPLESNNNIVEVHDTSPRIGLELNDRLQHSSGYKDDNPSPSSPASLDDTTQNPTFTAARVSDINESNGDNEAAPETFDEEYTDEPDEVAVFSAVKGPATCIFLTFTVTLCLFPSWVSELQSNHECKTHFRLSNDLYVPFSFLFFNVGDLFGRLLAEKIRVERVPHLSKKLVLGASLRAVFFPLFLTCLSTVGSDSSLVVRSDLYSMIVQFLFAVTNGLLVSTSFMWSPHLVGHTTGMQERASEIMTFSVCFGLLSGSLLAFPFLEMATQILQ